MILFLNLLLLLIIIYLSENYIYFDNYLYLFNIYI